MQAVHPSLFNRPDTLLGVCEGIGQDFGFNPTILRVALAATMFWNPYFAIGGYFALGLFVLASRLLFPDVRAPRIEAQPLLHVPSKPRKQEEPAQAYAEAA